MLYRAFPPPTTQQKSRMPKNHNEKSKSASRVSRRAFITTASMGAAALGLTNAQSASVEAKPPGGDRKRIRWRFEARRIEEQFGDGSTVPFFRFCSVGTTRSNGRLPLMQDRENRTVSVSIKNLVDFPIQPTILNHASGPVIMPQETAIWEFTMPPEGTWIFTEGLLGIAASSAGFAAAMISNPAKPTRPQLRDYFLLYQDADDRWNNAIDNGNVPDETVFEPNYHTLNGLSYPNTLMDDSSRVSCKLGEDVLIRIANVSNIRHSIHFHGYHADLVRRNNTPESRFPEKDTFAIPSYSTSEIIMPVTQVGEYPLHPHGLTTTTDNGLYQGGSVTLIDATE